jgi:Tol biopolymer transport system component
VRRLVAAALATIGLVTVSTGANAGTPARNGRIAFAHAGGVGGFRIYTMTAAGTDRRALTPFVCGFSNYDPSFSPDGQRIAFVRASKQDDLWTMKANGADKRRLTWTRRIDELHPTWSPDGTQLAFAVDRPLSRQGIWVEGLDGHGRRRLTNGPDSDPSWSPGGSEIAFTRADAATQTSSLLVVPAVGGTVTKLSSDPGVSDLQPDWSPDGNRILFVSDRPDTFQLDLWVMNADGSDVQRVTSTPFFDEHNPAWSPDGRRIVYVGESSSHGAASYQLFVSKANGSGRRIITHACGACAVLNDEPSWQPLTG